MPAAVGSGGSAATGAGMSLGLYRPQPATASPLNAKPIAPSAMTRADVASRCRRIGFLFMGDSWVTRGGSHGVRGTRRERMLCPTAGERRPNSDETRSARAETGSGRTNPEPGASAVLRRLRIRLRRIRRRSDARHLTRSPALAARAGHRLGGRRRCLHSRAPTSSSRRRAQLRSDHADSADRRDREPPTRRRPRSTCSNAAARPPTPPWRRRWCSTWSSRSPRASAAARWRCTGTQRRGS